MSLAPATPESEFSRLLPLVADHIKARSDNLSELPTLPRREDIACALESLPAALPDQGLGTEKTVRHLLDEVVMGLGCGQAGPRYFGFVTGGVTPAAQLADILVSSYDSNVQVHLPSETISTTIEARALEFLLDLLGIERDTFQGRTTTTGATASNVLGLTCGRDAAFARRLEGWCVAEDGFPPGGGVEVLGVKVHASIVKAAAIVGIGRKNCIDLDDGYLKFDLVKLEARLKANVEAGKDSIIVVGAGEVNTGNLSTQMKELRALADKYPGSWIHIDAAFGAFAALLPEFDSMSKDFALADSLTADGHKWLNVPYDLGIFFTRSTLSLYRSFGPSPSQPPPAYLTPSADDLAIASASSSIPIPSPLNMGIENSRRFRALPLYASLLSLGRSGFADIIRNNVGLAARIRAYMATSPYWEVLNPDERLNIVLFRGSDRLAAHCAWHPNHEAQGPALVKAINEGRVIYVSPSVWGGKGAARLAVGNWLAGTGGEIEWEKIQVALEAVVSLGRK